MDQRVTDNVRERSRRPIRNKRCSRRNIGEEKRPPKRLFTPEIKRYLKSWLVRRRDNPYPNRDEKKALAVQTGLTYIQVCNWFANWRRKLKNAGKEPQRKTWGHLIKHYNDQVQGNVEHFSICSNDSIWNDDSTVEVDASNEYQNFKHANVFQKENLLDHCYTVENDDPAISNNNTHPQCYYISSTTGGDVETHQLSSNKYKNHIMEKYLRDCQMTENYLPGVDNFATGEDLSKPSIISRWRESAANFRPSENNYLHWTLTKPQKKKSKKSNAVGDYHRGRDELDAAETLTKLANANANFNNLL